MKKVVVIGGGTGNFVVLSGLKRYDVDLSAIVTMADDGGSTGILRDELGVLPPGDVRQCLVALSNSSRLMRNLMDYRFSNGGLEGHSFGNLLLSALEKVTGSFEKAVEEAGQIISIKGKVIPVTTHQVRLKMMLKNRKVLESQKEIYLSQDIDKGYLSIYLSPTPKANQRAINEIINADLIILGPGDIYSSLIPNLLVGGISKALRDSKAKKVFIVNLMNKKGQTTQFKVSDHLKEISSFTGGDIFDYVLTNSKLPSPKLLGRYSAEGELVENDFNDNRLVSADLLSDKETEYSENDALAKYRTFIRHDSDKLAKVVMEIVSKI